MRTPRYIRSNPVWRRVLPAILGWLFANFVVSWFIQPTPLYAASQLASLIVIILVAACITLPFRPRPELSPFQCPRCGWWTSDDRAQHRLSHTKPVLDDFETKKLGIEVLAWKETWRCPLCHTQFTFTNSNA